jgi:hypothetical protein
MKLSTGNQRGQALVFLTMALTLLFGMLGLTVDVGWMYFREQAARAAAESAAQAAVSAAVASSPNGLACGVNHVVCQTPTACPSQIGTPADNIQAGCLYARDNGFQVSTARQNVLMAANTTNTTIAGIKSQYWVSVTVVETVPQTFSAILGKTLGTVSSRATAGLVGAIMGDCIYALNASNGNAMQVTGNGNVNSGCGIWVNSSSATALQVKGNGVIAVGAGGINIVGNDTGSNTNISPAPTIGVAHFSDPLAGIPDPVVRSCDHASQVSISSGSPVLNPGVYCGGISISGGTATFNPGMYVLNGGGLAVSGTPNISGSGVVFYNTGDATHAFSSINVAGQATVTLSAPITGPYSNMLFLEDRSKGSDAVLNTFSGGATVNLTGVMYARNSMVVYAGGSAGSSPKFGIVADEVQVTGNAFLVGGISGSGSGTGGKVALIE